MSTPTRKSARVSFQDFDGMSGQTDGAVDGFLPALSKCSRTR
jgi:hypothetical protein